MISQRFNAHNQKTLRPILSTHHAGDGTQADSTSFINQECVTMPDLIDRLLELSRVQAGTLDLRLEACQLSEILQASVEQLQYLAPQHRLCVDVGADVLPVLADPRRVQQVLAALVENAAKYSPEGSTIWINAHRQNGWIQVNVSDQGTGIGPEDRQRVFEAYRQPEYQMTAHAGLGLAISKGLVELQGGSIWISDRSRKGFRTTVSFTLPVVTASNWKRISTRQADFNFASESLMAEPYRMPV